MGTRRILALAAVTALMVGACGGDDDTSSDDANASVDDTSVDDSGDESNGDDEGDASGGVDGTCEGTDLQLTNLSTGATVAITDTAAVALEDGAAYTAYLTDFEIDPSEVTSFSNPSVPEDGNMATLFITVYDAAEVPPPIEAGTEIEYSDEFGVLTFGVIHTAGEEHFGDSTNAGGNATVTAVGDSLCVEIDYADDEKTLVGTLEAAVTSV